MYRFLFFIGLPLIEMALLIWVGDKIGLLATLAIIIITGIAGASLVKRQGLAIWVTARQRLAEGTLPAREMAHGAMLLVAGAFLLAPGFITDFTGLLLLIPTVREWLRRRIGSRFMGRTTTRVDVWR